MKKTTYMHFEEVSIIYIWSKFQLDTCMFDSNILLTKFGSGFWFRIRALVPGFIPSLEKRIHDSYRKPNISNQATKKTKNNKEH